MVFLNWCSFDIKKESSWNNFKECKIKFLPFTCAYFTLQLLVCSDYNKNHSFAKIVAFTGSSSAWNFWQKGAFSAYLFSSTYKCNISLEFIRYKMCQKTLSQFSAERLKGEKDELLVGGSLFECFSTPFPIICL